MTAAATSMDLPLPALQRLRDILQSGLQAPSAENRHYLRFEIAGDRVKLLSTDTPTWSDQPHRRMLALLSYGAVVENMTTHYVDDTLPQKAKWARVECDFPNIKGSNTTGERDDIFTLAKNPGEYEFKLLWNNKLSRSIKFTVQPGGKFDNGIASANKLGSDIVIVPVTVLGDQDGMWNKTAWKTDAFYGNPLNGFTAGP